MTTYVDDGDGLPQCKDCADGECITAGYICEAPDCRCGCRLDQRPQAALARDIERERYGDVRELVAERYSGGRRG